MMYVIILFFWVGSDIYCFFRSYGIYIFVVLNIIYRIVKWEFWLILVINICKHCKSIFILLRIWFMSEYIRNTKNKVWRAYLLYWDYWQVLTSSIILGRRYILWSLLEQKDREGECVNTNILVESNLEKTSGIWTASNSYLRLFFSAKIFYVYKSISICILFNWIWEKDRTPLFLFSFSRAMKFYLFWSFHLYLCFLVVAGEANGLLCFPADKHPLEQVFL